MNNSPIGIFDSGLGGLTVLKQIKKQLPNENIIYLGDTARVPYGTRSKETIVKFAIQDAEFLISNKVKAIVIACNTASAYAYQEVKKLDDVAVFDVITPAVDAALKKRNSNRFTVIGTKATISSQTYQRLILDKCKECKIEAQACTLFVPMIEEGEIKGKLIELVASRYLSHLKGKQDVLIMGCTHYPIIKEVIMKIIDNNTFLVDPGVYTAQELKRYLKENNLLADSINPNYEYYLTDLGPGFKQVAEIFLGDQLEKIYKIELK